MKDTDDSSSRRQANGAAKPRDPWQGPVPVTRAAMEKTNFLAELAEEDAWRRKEEALARKAKRQRRE